MVEIYYGDEKSRLRMCIGAAVAAALREKNVLVADFTRIDSGYGRLFDIVPHITRLTLTPNAGVQEYFDHAVRIALSFQYSALILYDIFDTVAEGRLSAAEVYEFLSNAPDSIEIICTGQSADEKFCRIADEIVELSALDKEN